MALNLTSSIIPIGINPYEFYQGILIANMYPVVAKGFETRIVILLMLISYNAIVSIVYFILVIIDSKRPIWLAKSIQRPAGRYFTINQYLLYPISSFFMAILWIVFTIKIANMWGGNHGSPVGIFYWISLMWVPFYAQLWSTTFALLSASNLSSVGRSASKHFLSPITSNLIFFILFPLLLGLILGLGGWTGYCWSEFAELWQATYDKLGVAATKYGLTVNDQFQQDLCASEVVRHGYMLEFIKTQHSCMIVYIAAASMLIFINIVGLLTLLRALRSIARLQSMAPLPGLKSQTSTSPPILLLLQTSCLGSIMNRLNLDHASI